MIINRKVEILSFCSRINQHVPSGFADTHNTALITLFYIHHVCQMADGNKFCKKNPKAGIVLLILSKIWSWPCNTSTQNVKIFLVSHRELFAQTVCCSGIKKGRTEGICF